MITFCSCFFQLAHIDVGFSLFEEFPLRLPLRLWPVFKALVLSSGMLTTLGAMIGRNILLDSQGYLTLLNIVITTLLGVMIRLLLVLVLMTLELIFMMYNAY